MNIREANLRDHQDDRVIRTRSEPMKKNTGLPKNLQAKHVIVDPADDFVFGTVKQANTMG